MSDVTRWTPTGALSSEQDPVSRADVTRRAIAAETNQIKAQWIAFPYHIHSNFNVTKNLNKTLLMSLC